MRQVDKETQGDIKFDFHYIEFIRPKVVEAIRELESKASKHDWFNHDFDPDKEKKLDESI